ncbi:MAG TPA: hypothetical protein VHP36_10545 [Chitinispirillaceae bacterium]|nr:hypothetical protein [Chitinispirillaceae bacterium]
MRVPLFIIGKLIVLPLIFLLFSSSIAQSSYTNKRLGFSIELPAGWYVINESDSQDIFFDTVSNGKTFLSVLRHQIDTNIEESYWTKFHFLMYLSITQEWADPWGTILALDSSQSSTIDGTWAPQAFAQFVSLDSVNSNWAEYIMFTAKYRGGYEIYAIGDTLDLKSRGGTYSQIFQTISFSAPSSIKVNRKLSYKMVTDKYDQKIFDLSGRYVSSFLLNRNCSAVFIKNKESFVNNIRSCRGR